jgi:hypothetical protein
MRHFFCIVSVLAVLAVVACGGPSGREDNRPATPEQSAKAAAQEFQMTKSVMARSSGQPVAGEISLRLSEIRLTPSPLTVAVDLNAEPVLIDPAAKMTAFEYRWFVDDQPVIEFTGPVLERSRFQKGQWIYCDVRAIDGELLGPWLHSKHVRVSNTPPQLESSPLADFSVPGDLSYHVSAHDIDGDVLSYELLSPLEQGIAIDSQTGLLTWKIDVATVEKLGETIEIQFTVKDNEGGATSGSITLHLIAQNR